VSGESVNDQLSGQPSLSISPQNLTPVNSELFKDDISSCFGPGDHNVFRCEYLTLQRLLKVHGLDINSHSISEARALLTFHLAMGMCLYQEGDRCREITMPFFSHKTLNDCVLETITNLCHLSTLTLSDLRFVCNTIGVTLAVRLTTDEILHALQTALACASEARNFDLLSFFSNYEKATRHTVYQWCSAHGIYPRGSFTCTKLNILKHIVSAACNICAGNSKYTGCRPIKLQMVDSFQDANKKSFVLSVLSVADNVSCKTLQAAGEIILGPDLQSGSHHTVIQHKLRSFVFQLCRGRAVFLSILNMLNRPGLHARHSLMRCTWLLIAEQDLKEKIKCLFEENIISSCTRRTVCAACAVRYTKDEIAVFDVDDVDVSPLLLPTNVESDSPTAYSNTAVDHDGPFASLLINKKGVIYETQFCEGPACLTLCSDCLHSLQRSRVPKFALVNHLFLGEVPEELCDLSPVEESMIALCRLTYNGATQKYLRGRGMLPTRIPWTYYFSPTGCR
jgi:hypothetical protein